MESTGCPGRIQVSQTTADLLISRGKGHWLTPREDKVIAKGKGEMQTYFVTTTVKTATTRNDSTEASDHGFDHVVESFMDSASGDKLVLETLKEENSQPFHVSDGASRREASESSMEKVEDHLQDYLHKNINRG